MTSKQDTGRTIAIGVGIGAAFAVSMGPIGWLLGLGGSVAVFAVGREISRRRHS